MKARVILFFGAAESGCLQPVGFQPFGHAARADRGEYHPPRPNCPAHGCANPSNRRDHTTDGGRTWQ